MNFKKVNLFIVLIIFLLLVTCISFLYVQNMNLKKAIGNDYSKTINYLSFQLQDIKEIINDNNALENERLLKVYGTINELTWISSGLPISEYGQYYIFIRNQFSELIDEPNNSPKAIKLTNDIIGAIEHLQFTYNLIEENCGTDYIKWYSALENTDEYIGKKVISYLTNDDILNYIHNPKENTPFMVSYSNKSNEGLTESSQSITSSITIK